MGTSGSASFQMAKRVLVSGASFGGVVGEDGGAGETEVREGRDDGSAGQSWVIENLLELSLGWRGLFGLQVSQTSNVSADQCGSGRYSTEVVLFGRSKCLNRGFRVFFGDGQSGPASQGSEKDLDATVVLLDTSSTRFLSDGGSLQTSCGLDRRTTKACRTHDLVLCGRRKSSGEEPHGLHDCQQPGSPANCRRSSPRNA